MALISRGFKGRRQSAGTADRLPPGQYETRDFPVLSAGPTPQIPLASWDFTLRAADGKSARWSWDEFTALPRQTITKDIHCVTKWSRFDTVWEGIAIDTLFGRCLERRDTVTLRVGTLRWWLHDQCSARRSDRRQGMDRFHLRW